MNPYSTKLAEAFAAQIIKIYFEVDVTPKITNSNYEGQIKDKATVCNILTLGGVTRQPYTGSAMTPQALLESNGQLKTDQGSGYYFTVTSLEVLKSFIKNPEGDILEKLEGQLREEIDGYVLAFWPDVAAGNRVGTDYSTGDITITDVTGALVGNDTVLVAAMVGRGIKAVGHSKWYRLKSISSTTAGYVENDEDDVTSHYDGGTITSADYVLEAATAIQLTKNNIYEYLLALFTKLNKTKTPKTNRWVVVPSEIGSLIKLAPEYIPAVPSAYEDVVKNGFIVKMAGFMVYENEEVAGDAVNGWHIMAGHPSAITFGMAMTDSHVEPFVTGNSGKGYVGINVYGAKVVDERRKALAELFGKL